MVCGLYIHPIVFSFSLHVYRSINFFPSIDKFCAVFRNRSVTFQENYAMPPYLSISETSCYFLFILPLSLSVAFSYIKLSTVDLRSATLALIEKFYRNAFLFNN